MAHALRPRDYGYRPPRKVRIGALKSALSLFVQEGRMTVVDNFDLDTMKTKIVAQSLGKLEAGEKSLIVDGKDNDNLRVSLRNMQQHQFLPPEGVNVYDLLRHKHLVLTKDAAKALEARCLGAVGGGSGVSS